MKRWHGSTIGGTCLLAAVVLTMSGCGSFDRAWQAAEAPAPQDHFTGRWVGTWRSDYNDHTGDLRAIVQRNDDGTYHVHYHATYGGIFTYAYDLDVEVEQRDGVYHFSGEADLGMFGTYSHDGHATPTEFVADYDSSGSDHGVYEMRRPEEDLHAAQAVD